MQRIDQKTTHASGTLVTDERVSRESISLHHHNSNVSSLSRYHNTPAEIQSSSRLV